MEQAEGESDRDDRLCLPQTPGDVPDTTPIIPLPSPDRHLQHQRQVQRLLQQLHCHTRFMKCKKANTVLETPVQLLINTIS